MIDKGEEIIRHYPLIGVGPNNFKFYKAELNTYKTYDRLQSIEKKIFDNKTSAHNTYLQVVTEFGVIGALLYVLILIKPVWLFFKNFISSNLTVEHLSLISLFGILIHFYTIANLSGALPWFILGLSWTYFQPMIRKT
jgi:O-antigen ligase